MTSSQWVRGGRLVWTLCALLVASGCSGGGDGKGKGGDQDDDAGSTPEGDGDGVGDGDTVGDGDALPDAGDGDGPFDPAKCGNGADDPGEECDDGNDGTDDGCDTLCRIEEGYACPVVGATCEECGNGVKESSEGCDDGNRDPNDGCSAQCKIEEGNWFCPIPGTPCELCGDGVVDANERCDEGDSADNVGCSGDCRMIDADYHCFDAGQDCVLCGDGVRDSGEACDDGNHDTGDGCVPTCIAVEAGWVCPDGGGDCTLCGDGKVANGLEECDDGNFQDGDGCSTGCVLEEGAVCLEVGVLCSVCGNGYIEPVAIDDKGTVDTSDDVITLEQCDDGNLDPEDGCSQACLQDAAYDCAVPGIACNDCGNGVVEGLERCDEGAAADGVGCSLDCYTVSPGYNCLDGNVACVECGNGKVEAGEACDDGTDPTFNVAVGGDGCSRDCKTVEAGFTCTSDASGLSTCIQCGNGIKEGAEACDDFDTDSGDGCSATCTVEAGYNCYYPGFPCVQCGNAKVEPGEGCDEGTFNTGGCLNCQVTNRWVCPLAGQPCELCGDSEVGTFETCDDGVDAQTGLPVSGDGCSSTCEIEPGYECETGKCLAAACGDGAAAGEEECDDGNSFSGDGCSIVCQVEDGFVCDATSCRKTVCGDTVVEGDEQCDDGNAGTPGCDANCQLEAGYKCPDAGQPCKTTTCGDGSVEGSEQCDDGDLTDPGCDAITCQFVAGYACDALETRCNGGTNDGQLCTSEFSCPDNGLADRGDCSVVMAPCHQTVPNDGIVEGTEECDDLGAGGVCRGGSAFGTACTSDAQCTGGGVCVDGCTDNKIDPFYRCDGEPSECRPILEFVAVRRFNISNVSPDGLVYDPERRAFAGHKQVSSQKAIELCLDGTVIDPNDTLAGPLGTMFHADGTNEALDASYVAAPRPVTDGSLLEAAYDPFTGHYLFLSIKGGTIRLDEVPLCTVQSCPAGSYFDLATGDITKYRATLSGANGAEGLTVGEDGDLYVTDNTTKTVVVFPRHRDGNGNIVVPDCVTTPATNCTTFDSTASRSFSAPATDTLDAIFTVPGEDMVAVFNAYTGGASYTGRDALEGGTYSTSEYFSFYEPSLGTNPPLYGRSALPGLLFRLGDVGRSYAKFAQSAETATDGGSFIICPTNPSEDCQLFARTCETDEDCAAIVPGTRCNTGAPVPYCSSPGEARDDHASVERSSSGNVIDVLANDSRSESSCQDPIMKVVSLTGPNGTGPTATTEQGGTVTISNGGDDVTYTAPADTCGFIDAFTYTADLGGGVTDSAVVRVVVRCVCGDGVRDDNEQCDLGGANGAYPARCSTSCSLNVFCGDAIVDPGEQCDNGKCSGGTTPGKVCTSNAACGDGGVCAATTAVSGDGCSAHCTLESVCGDGKVEGVEQCDPGASASCNDNCTLPVCGDGNVDVAVGEQCDDGLNNGTAGSSCTKACTVLTVCGNSILELGEQCDDGGVVSGDGCSSTCRVEGSCGNGTVDGSEECDPTASATQCGGHTCLLDRCLCENYCGDGRIGGLEQCDDGNASAGDGCRPDCSLEMCGDTLVDKPAEQCDDGNTDPTDKCANNCQIVAICGDGIVDPGEECDDGKNVSGDGCSSTCKNEVTVCGNAMREFTEQCDDGSQCTSGKTCTVAADCTGIGDGTCAPRAGDGCSATCTTEGAICGNKKLEAGEECDDGNTMPGDGCSKYCTNELL